MFEPCRNCKLWACAVICVGLFNWQQFGRDALASEPEPAAVSMAGSMTGKEAGQVRDDNGLGMNLVWCRPGHFRMANLKEMNVRVLDANGNPEVQTSYLESPAADVFLTRGYWIGKHEVTQAEWQSVMRTEPWLGHNTKAGDDLPANWVSWTDAMEFCDRLTRREREAGRLPEQWKYTLPTESQWERACRAGTETTFSFGDDESKLADYAWYCSNVFLRGERHAHGVGQKPPNAWGLCDMHGNLLEWCFDAYQPPLPRGRDPVVTGETTGRVVRGGSWKSSAFRCNSSHRIQSHRDATDPCVGFRVALVAVRSN